MKTTPIICNRSDKVIARSAATKQSRSFGEGMRLPRPLRGLAMTIFNEV